ncbi:MAG: hypothetical protein WCT85_02040 [Parachlamydiales bacterium]|jgi:hypothetical protein
MSTSATNFSINVNATPELMKSIAAYQAKIPGAEDELGARISEVVNNKIPSVDKEEEKTQSSKWSFATVATVTAAVVGIFSYAFGYSRGNENILNRISAEEAGRIRKDLERESADALDLLDGYIVD